MLIISNVVLDHIICNVIYICIINMKITIIFTYYSFTYICHTQICLQKKFYIIIIYYIGYNVYLIIFSGQTYGKAGAIMWQEFRKCSFTLLV